MFRLLRLRVEEKVADWKGGAFDASIGSEFIARNSLAKGYVNACEDMLSINFEDLQGNGK